MGSTPSKTRVDQTSQYPPNSASRPSSSPVVLYASRSRGRTRTPPSSVYPPRPRARSPPSTVVPIRPVLSSPSTYVDHQRSSSNDQLTSYAQIWDNNGKLSSTFEGRVNPPSRQLIEHVQEENQGSELTSEESSRFATVEMHSILKSEVETKHRLTSSDQLDEFIDQLKKSNSTFDGNVQQRIQQITTQTEAILGRIFHETEDNQQELLQRAKEEQIKEDQFYRQQLEEFLRQLDLQRAKRLDQLQSKLVAQRQSILEESQLKVRSLVGQANSLKTQIMSEEEQQATRNIDAIIEQINQLNEHPTFQQLGTQTTTQIHLTRQETIGTTNINNTNKRK